MDSNTILKKLDCIQSIPTLPAIAMELNTMLQDSDTSVQQLKQTLEKDQAIVPNSEIHPASVTAMNDTLKSASMWFPGQLEEIQTACQFFIE